MLVLGSQKLTELRDSICCVSDLQIGGEFSNTPDFQTEVNHFNSWEEAMNFLFEGQLEKKTSERSTENVMGEPEPGRCQLWNSRKVPARQ